MDFVLFYFDSPKTVKFFACLIRKYKYRMEQILDEINKKIIIKWWNIKY